MHPQVQNVDVSENKFQVLQTVEPNHKPQASPIATPPRATPVARKLSVDLNHNRYASDDEHIELGERTKNLISSTPIKKRYPPELPDESIANNENHDPNCGASIDDAVSLSIIIKKIHTVEYQQQACKR